MTHSKEQAAVFEIAYACYGGRFDDNVPFGEDIPIQSEERAIAILRAYVKHDNTKLRNAMDEAIDRIQPLVSMGMCSPREAEAIGILRSAQM